MNNKLNFLLSGLIVLMIVHGISAEGFALNESEGTLVAENDDGKSSEKSKYREPSQQAVQACAMQSVGYSCTFMSSQGDVIQGVCEIMPGDIIACLPDNRSHH